MPTVAVVIPRNQRPQLTCQHCGSSFTPGAGRSVPDACVGCRVPYDFDADVRAMLDTLTDGSTR